jgi:hypothetical protein
METLYCMGLKKRLFLGANQLTPTPTEHLKLFNVRNGKKLFAGN